MILVDSSVWIDHFRSANFELARLLNENLVLAHPFVTGNIILGNLRNRRGILVDLLDLPQAPVATDEEVRDLIERRGLFGTGIGYVDAHLLASVRLTADATFWTRDRRLGVAAEMLAITRH